MSRSIKKGPYVQEALMKRVLAMNEAGEKKVLSRPGAVQAQYSLISSDIHLLYTTAESTFPYM